MSKDKIGYAVRVSLIICILAFIIYTGIVLLYPTAFVLNVYRNIVLFTVLTTIGNLIYDIKRFHTTSV